MSRARCSICTHADKQAIDAALEAGVSQLAVGRAFNASRFALSRHRKHCLAVTAQAGEGSGSASELAKWMKRADDLYLAASTNGDITRAVAALTAAFRGLAASEKQREREREEQAKDAPSDALMTVELMDLSLIHI